MWTQISGRMPASSQASRALSTASLTVVSRALRGLSKPSRWRFLAKNSLTEMSRWLAAIDWAVARRRLAVFRWFRLPIRAVGVAVDFGVQLVVVDSRFGFGGGVAAFREFLGHGCK